MREPRLPAPHLIGVFDEMIAGYGDAPGAALRDAAIREPVATALFSKGFRPGTRAAVSPLRVADSLMGPASGSRDDGRERRRPLIVHTAIHSI